jgi:hypothetical protein
MLTTERARNKLARDYPKLDKSHNLRAGGPAAKAGDGEPGDKSI